MHTYVLGPKEIVSRQRRPQPYGYAVRLFVASFCAEALRAGVQTLGSRALDHSIGAYPQSESAVGPEHSFVSVLVSSCSRFNLFWNVAQKEPCIATQIGPTQFLDTRSKITIRNKCPLNVWGK